MGAAAEEEEEEEEVEEDEVEEEEGVVPAFTVEEPGVAKRGGHINHSSLLKLCSTLLQKKVNLDRTSGYSQVGMLCYY